MIVGRLGLLNPWLIRIGLAVPIVVELVLRVRRSDVGRQTWDRERGRGWSLGVDPRLRGTVAGPFLLIMALGAMLPTVDFDAIEYHVQGPKEYFQAGRIAFLPHNVYTSMPFSIEMLHLLGMEVVGDWWLGALVGQLLVAAFRADASAVLIGLTAQRIGSNRAAWVAAIVYLTTPWIYRLAVLPYVEGPLCYFHAALLWAVAPDSGLRTQNSGPEDSTSLRPSGSSVLSPLVGLLAGGAMATKYPALISAVIPFSAWAAWIDLAVAETGGLPWAMRWAWRWSWPPGWARTWSIPATRFTRSATRSSARGTGTRLETPSGRPPTGRSRSKSAQFGNSIVDVAGRSDWQSPLYAALAPLAFLRRGSRRSSRMAGGLLRLSLSDLVVAHPPARPVLAADLAASGDPGGPGSRLGSIENLDGVALDGHGGLDRDERRLLLDGPGGPERVDGRPGQAPH